MRFLCCLFFTFYLATKAEAQLNHFIYIQTDNRQTFYVKLNEKLFSSTATGYLIIPKLKDGQYTLNIGFPKEEWPLQQVPVTVNNKDEGFLLKNFDGKGWGLFNIQSLEIVKGITPGNTIAIISEPKTDAFSNTLAAVTNTAAVKEKTTQAVTTVQVDSMGQQKLPLKKGEDSIIENTSKAQQEPAKPQVEVIQKADTVLQVQATLVNEVPGAVPEPVKVNPGIKQIFSLLDNSGRTILYSMAEGFQTDTVRLFIPYSGIVQEATELVKPPEEKEPRMPEQTDIIKTDTALTIIEKPLITDIKVTDVAQQAKVQPVITLINAACKSLAGENDFLKLRKKMAGENNEEDMLDVARKGFRAKCYSSSQVKNLGLLFLKEENRYAFFDEAYEYVSDPEYFNELQSQLTTEYYINRFKAMLR